MMNKSRQIQMVKLFLPFAVLLASTNTQAVIITGPAIAANADITIDGGFDVTSAVAESGTSVFGLVDPLDSTYLSWGDATGVPGGAVSSLKFTAFSYDTTAYNLVDGWKWNGASLVADAASDGYISKVQYDALSGVITPKLDLTTGIGFNTGDYALLGQFEFTNGKINANSGISSISINLNLNQPNSILGNQSTGPLTVNIANTPNACDTVANPNCAFDGISIALADGGVEQNLILTEWLIQEDGTESALFWGQIGSLLPSVITTGSGSSVTVTTDTSGVKTITDSQGNTTIVNVPTPGALALMLLGLPLLLVRKTS